MQYYKPSMLDHVEFNLLNRLLSHWCAVFWGTSLVICSNRQNLGLK
jgi:hypothetical protein